MPTYLDYNATAPVRPEVSARMQEILSSPTNPSSAHSFGRAAKKHLEDARKIIADAISAWPDELLFCGSATEANATALRGASRPVFVSAIEHSSVLSSLRGSGATEAIQKGKQGWIASPAARNDIIPVVAEGIINLDSLESMLAAAGSPALVSVMLANNETGVIQPVREVAEICKKHGALFHCDAVQGLGKIPVDFGAIGCDMMTIAAHKCGGPVGASALIVKRGAEFLPLLMGGGQEGRRRAGTENVAAIAGFALAVQKTDLSHMSGLRHWLDSMEAEMVALGATVFGKKSPRLPNTTCVAMPGVSNEVQLMDFDLKGFAVSAGSACSSGRIEPSHVLLAMSVEKEVAASAIRISGGWQTNESDIKAFAAAWKSTCERLATSRVA